MNEHEKLKAVLTSTQLYAEGVQRKTNTADCIKAILNAVEAEEKALHLVRGWLDADALIKASFRIRTYKGQLYEELRYYEKGENDGS